MRGLVDLGIDLGVDLLYSGEVFYYPENDVVDHTRMPTLLLKPRQFEEMKQELTAEFGNRAKFLFADEQVINASLKKMKIDSLRE
jgi:hypothetical protein